MIAFLTSTLGDFYMMDEMTVGLVEKNGFVENLHKVWQGEKVGLFISADPEDFAGNDRMRDEFFRAFSDAGLKFSSLDVCDNRCPKIDDISKIQVIILGGGHVPTENKFIEKINLFEKITKFDGIFLSLSAGSMNSARVVYSIPELEGEAIDPSYNRFLRGLGITECMMLPHYQYFKDVYLDGLHVVHDITVPDSFGRKIYAMPDGSYILCHNGEEFIYGEAHLISDGEIRQICRDGENIKIK